jgi:hypothetical protein
MDSKEYVALIDQAKGHLWREQIRLLRMLADPDSSVPEASERLMAVGHALDYVTGLAQTWKAGDATLDAALKQYVGDDQPSTFESDWYR